MVYQPLCLVAAGLPECEALFNKTMLYSSIFTIYT